MEAADARVADLTEQLASAESERVALDSRAETLELSLTRKDGVGALLAADGVSGTIGSVAALLAVDPRDEEAVVAALGAIADAVAVESVEAAVDAIRYLRTEDAGRVSLLVGGSAQAPAAAGADRRAASGPSTWSRRPSSVRGAVRRAARRRPGGRRPGAGARDPVRAPRSGRRDPYR